MPMFVDLSRGGPLVVARGSLAVEIDWALSAADRLGSRPVSPLLEDLYRTQPDLRDEVTSLWGAEEQLSYPGYLELSVLAHHGGLLFSLDSDLLLDSLETLAAAPPSDLVLASETPEDRAQLMRRLRLLRTSAKRRKHYVDVVRRVWSQLRPAWEERGRPAVERSVDARSAPRARRPSWQDLVPLTCQPQTLEDLVAARHPGDEVAVVPAYFSGNGLIVDLPGVVVVGVPTDGTGDDERARAELLARRLKAVADPTRLAILAALGRDELTVSDVAKRFGLAQPTVSNHVKLLRDAGFVTTQSDGRNRRLVVERAGLEELGGELRDLLGD